MNLRVYELFVAPLRVEDKDRYCVEASSIEGLFGIPEGHSRGASASFSGTWTECMRAGKSA